MYRAPCCVKLNRFCSVQHLSPIPMRSSHYKAGCWLLLISSNSSQFRTDAAVVSALLWFSACSTRLGWIVIYLIVIEVIVGLLEILGLFGVVGEH
jgi:hypothetical protein